MVAVLTKKKIRVILADDHPVVRDGLAAMVNQQADMEVVAEAGDGDEAISLYEQHQPDVMVLDLRMPKRDGVAVVQRVLEINPKARLLIMTTYDGDEDIFQCLSQGAKGYLLKDMDPDTLVAALHEIIAGQTVVTPELTKVLARVVQRGGPDRHRSPTLLEDLTPRELEILRHLAEGESNKIIARRLGICDGTVKLHVKAILRKLGLSSRVEAAVLAAQRGLDLKP